MRVTPDDIVTGAWTQKTSGGVVVNFLNGERHTVIGSSGIPNAGKGLFAARAFEKGELIGFYGGNVTKDTSGDVSYTLTFKVVSSEGDVVESIVDAKGIETRDQTKSRGDVHMANDSPGFSNAMFTVFGFMRATRDITEGEELYVSYGWQYWSEMMRLTDDLFLEVHADPKESEYAYKQDEAVEEEERNANAAYFRDVR